MERLARAGPQVAPQRDRLVEVGAADAEPLAGGPGSRTPVRFQPIPTPTDQAAAAQRRPASPAPWPAARRSAAAPRSRWSRGAGPHGARPPRPARRSPRRCGRIRPRSRGRRARDRSSRRSTSPVGSATSVPASMPSAEARARKFGKTEAVVHARNGMRLHSPQSGARTGALTRSEVLMAKHSKYEREQRLAETERVKESRKRLGEEPHAGSRRGIHRLGAGRAGAPTGRATARHGPLALRRGRPVRATSRSHPRTRLARDGTPRQCASGRSPTRWPAPAVDPPPPTPLKSRTSARASSPSM